MKDRRDFLKLFGLGTAAIATVDPLPGAKAAAPGDANMVVETIPPAEISPVQAFQGSVEARAVPNLLQVCDAMLWSQLEVERNDMLETYSLFQEPLGLRRDLAKTNMEHAGMLPAPSMFCIKQIGFFFSAKTIPALRSAFVDRYVLSLTLGRKTYWQAPLASLFAVRTPASEDAAEFASLPDAAFAALEIPLIIGVGMNFKLEAIGSPMRPCGTLKGWGVFKGLLARGIQ